MGILKKHAEDNYLDNTYDNFEERLGLGNFPVRAIPPHLLYGSRCVTCDEEVTALRYRGRRIDLIIVMGNWALHQCPNEPEYGERDDILEAQAEARGEIWPDDPNVRDGDGNIRDGGWTDPGTEPRDFPDDPYMYPDIPYVPPR